MDIKPDSHNPSPTSDNSSQSNSTNGESASSTSTGRSISATDPKSWLRQVWEYFFPQTNIRDRSITPVQLPMSYQKFRNLGQGVTGSVQLVHKAPQDELKKTEATESNDSSSSDIETILARTLSLMQTEPQKVPGIRQLAEVEPPVHTSSSELLAKKEYTIKGASPEDEPEYSLLKKMDHPNIVKLKDSKTETEMSTTGEPITHIKLYTESGVANLRQIKKIAPLSSKEFSILIGHIINGVNYLHENRITHNDLKPDNVILMPDMTAKLIDFGLSIDFSYGQQQGKLTPDQLGTFGYRAPEIGNNSFESDSFNALQSSDLWSLGCIVYEMVAGQNLFQPEETVPNNLETYLSLKINDIPNDIDGWNTADIIEIKKCLNDLLCTVPEKRSLSRLKEFTDGHT